MQIIINPTHNEIKKAAKALKNGHLVAFPTETVYGLGANANNKKAVNRIYSVKGRPINHPLIVHISSTNQLDKWARNIPSYATRLAQEFWPGPMTLILQRNDLAKDYITGGQDSVGLRVPNHFLALELLKEFEKIGGQGIAAPSANKFMAVSPTTAQAVQEEIGMELNSSDFILDDGPSQIGIESTIIDCTRIKPNILRMGFISEEQISSIVKLEESKLLQEKLRFSGIFKKHYAPKARVLLDVEPISGQGFIALSSVPTPKNVIRIASPKNSIEFAHLLYESLRGVDRSNIAEVVVHQPRGKGVASAVRERLKKAALQE
jgi:L-threonylcarbamoyladenylate synthase